MSKTKNKVSLGTLLIYFNVLLLILIIAASYYRFMVTKDYLIIYEGDCDPASQVCYEYCEDEDCAEPFYYSLIEKNAGATYDVCGEDVTQCDLAYECLDGEYCELIFCDPEIDGPESCVSNLIEI